MPRFYFDVHADSLSDWDDDGEVLDCPDEAVGLARDILLETLMSNDRSGADAHAVAVIRDETGANLVTVTLGSGDALRVLWARD